MNENGDQPQLLIDMEDVRQLLWEKDALILSLRKRLREASQNASELGIQLARLQLSKEEVP